MSAGHSEPKSATRSDPGRPAVPIDVGLGCGSPAGRISTASEVRISSSSPLSVAGGMVFVNSGYGVNGGRAGNALLAFSIQ